MIITNSDHFIINETYKRDERGNMIVTGTILSTESYGRLKTFAESFYIRLREFGLEYAIDEFIEQRLPFDLSKDTMRRFIMTDKDSTLTQEDKAYFAMVEL